MPKYGSDDAVPFCCQFEESISRLSQMELRLFTDSLPEKQSVCFGQTYLSHLLARLFVVMEIMGLVQVCRARELLLWPRAGRRVELAVCKRRGRSTSVSSTHGLKARACAGDAGVAAEEKADEFVSRLRGHVRGDEGEGRNGQSHGYRRTSKAGQAAGVDDVSST
jgi:hypothetical protein